MYEIVKFSFPFADNFDKTKPRPALVISPSFGKYNQLVIAYITKDVKDRLETDVLIDSKKYYFTATGLRTSSLIKLHRLITVTPSQIGISIGKLPDELVYELKEKLLKIFQLESMEETLYTLRHSMRDIKRAEKEIAKGNVVTLDEMRKQLDKRKAKEKKPSKK